MSRLTIFCGVLLLATSSLSWARENEELEQLLQILDEETEIATKTRLNADYVPGMVTVLHGSQIERLGVRTLWEALTLVPGIDAILEHTGGLGLTARGIEWTFASGNIKLMLNGLALNSAFSGTHSGLLQMPVEQIERIEVIRGPGSAVHGEYAYGGVVNVITRSGGTRTYVRAGSHDTVGAGAVVSYRADDRDLAVDLSISGWDSSGQDTAVDYDWSSQIGWPSHAPGNANEDANFRSALLQVQADGTVIKAQWLRDGSGDFYGSNYDVPPDPDQIVFEKDTQQLELSRNFAVRGVEGRAYVAASKFASQSDGMYLWADDSSGQVEDVLGRSRYDEQQTRAGLEVSREGERHDLALGVEVSHSEVLRSSSAYTMDPITYLWTPYYNEFSPLITAGTERRLTSVTLQDAYRWRDDLTLTTGLRYDDYSDVGSRLTPRLALVWRQDRENIFKFQYGRAFRPPTFYELAGAFSGPITPSLIDTLEAGYIYRGPDSLARVTLFHSCLTDFIRFSAFPYYSYVNVGQQTSEGVELEYERQYSHRFKASGNLSYLHTHDEDSGGPIPGSSNWMANIVLGYEITPLTLLDLRLHYVGEIYREPGDTRDRLDASQQVDVTVSWLDVGQKGLDMSAGVSNILDEDNRYPSTLDSTLDDFARTERRFWARATYHF